MKEGGLDLGGELTAMMIHDALKTRTNLTSPYKLLDMGTGKGVVVEFLREQGIKAYGIDTRTVFPSREYFIRANAEDMPFAAGRFNAVIENLMLAQLFDTNKTDKISPVLTEMDRVLSPGGIFISGWGGPGLKPNFGRSIVEAVLLPMGYQGINGSNPRSLYVYQKPGS